ncbi:hypothetical protein DY000_02007336 [Brassica cretica]|uniref:Uncharacterized protein n=1 Tax=Brassica cretica TaxID=69181 RepID=A0ABQ7C3T0_BRACR|nr:hypothetical protein DY000_02007336 [Brassica cretica]
MVPKVGYHSYTEDTGVEVSRTGRDQVELAGRADSRDGRTRRRTQPRDAEISSPWSFISDISDFTFGTSPPRYVASSIDFLL